MAAARNNTEGFPHKGRIVYSIRYTLDAPRPTSAELVVPLNSQGNSLNGLTTADPPDRPLVTVKPGERWRFRGQLRQVLGVEVYRVAGQI